MSEEQRRILEQLIGPDPTQPPGTTLPTPEAYASMMGRESGKIAGRHISSITGPPARLQGGEGSMNVWQPTLAGRAGNAAADLAGALGASKYTQQIVGERVRGTDPRMNNIGIAEVVPVVGTAVDTERAKDAAKRGDYGEAALNSAFAGLDVLPAGAVLGAASAYGRKLMKGGKKAAAGAADRAAARAVPEIAPDHPSFAYAFGGRKAAYEILEEAPSASTRRVYKLMRLPSDSDDLLFPLFAGGDRGFKLGAWNVAADAPPSGLARRPGIHAMHLPIFDQGKVQAKSKPRRVWVEGEIPDYVDAIQEEADALRSGIQDRLIGPGEAYNFRTNTQAEAAGGWPIAGSFRPLRVLGDEDVTDILRQAQMDDQIEAALSGVSRNEASAITARLSGEKRTVASRMRFPWDPEADVPYEQIDDWAQEMAKKNAPLNEAEEAWLESHVRQFDYPPTADPQLMRKDGAMIEKRRTKVPGMVEARHPKNFVGPMPGQEGKVDLVGPMPGKSIDVPIEGFEAARASDEFVGPGAVSRFDPYEQEVPKGYYLSKVRTPEEEEILKQTKKAQKAIDEGDYTPYFDIQKRGDVDPANYPRSDRTIDLAGPTGSQADKTIAEYEQITLGTFTQDGKSIKDGAGNVVYKGKKVADAQDWLNAGKTVEERLTHYYNVGMKDPEAARWYFMRQLEQKYVDYYGKKPGREIYDEWARMMAATTGGSDPTSNLRTAMYAMNRHAKGLPAVPATGPTGRTISGRLPSPVGGRYIGKNVEMADRLSYDTIDAAGNPKRYNFHGNFEGYKAPTLDEQMSNIMGWKRDEFGKPAYGMFEREVERVAKKLGVDARELQEVAWAGFKNAKEGYSSKPMIQIVNEAIERTARILQITPEEAFRRGFIKREIPVFGLGGVGALGVIGDDDVSYQ